MGTCTALVFPAAQGDLTETYDHLTNSLIKLIYLVISTMKVNADPHIYIHFLYIWSLTQPGNDYQ